MIEIKKTVDYHQEIKRTFGITGACAIFMGICTFLAYKLVYAMTESNMISVVAALLAALVSYFGPMIALKNIEKP